MTQPIAASAPKPVEALGLRGMFAFPTQADAETYLRNLPDGYSGRAAKTDWGKWFVSYRWSEAAR